MEDDQTKSLIKKPSSDPHIPPPTDPYVTYQTPYPRRTSDEIQNPFIEFRRLADTAFSSFFSALPRVLGTEKFKEANIRESDQEFVKAFDKQAKEFEDRIAEMVRIRAEEAEGFRKKLEQEWEERRRENEQRMEEENQRWEMMRRGLERCPGLQPEGSQAKREPDTELDLYDGLKAYESAFYKPSSDTETTVAKECPWKDGRIEKKCPWDPQENEKPSWLNNLGWDGRRRAKNIPLHVPRGEDNDQSLKKNVDWQRYKDEEMDPFSDDDHVVPWLKLSPYSPLSLISNPDWQKAIEQGHISHDKEQAFMDLPWDEAFEDLMSVHKTGKLSTLAKRLVYWGGPNQWMTDMAIRGSLGSKWEEGFMVAALMGAVDGKRWKGFDGLSDRCMQLTGREFNKASTIPSDSNALDSSVNEDFEDDIQKEHFDDWKKLAKSTIEPRMWEAYEQMEQVARALFGNRSSPDKSYGARGMLWPTPEEVINALFEGNYMEHSDDKSMDKTKLRDSEEPSGSQQDSWQTSSLATSPWTSPDNENSESLISTFTTTTTRTLSDGSVETKRILKKRFADGREENSESTELQPSITPLVNDVGTQTIKNEQTKKQDPKGGWFWN